jgi:RNA polymerase sigma-70 factor (ECF subfamily)
MTTEQVLPAAARYAPARTVEVAGRPDFAEFYGEYFARVARYCYRLVRDEELARDLAQEAFARLYVRWVGLRDPAAYLFHVATNLARTAYRKTARENRALEAVPGPHRADHHHVHLAVSRLQRRYRELVLLYYFADLPIAAVAAAVRRPEGTVKRQLAEARRILADDLEA